MRIVRGLGMVVVVCVALILGVALAARLSDGPIAIFAGGPLVAGDLVGEKDVDFSFATDIAEIEFQLLRPPRSRTVWILVNDGKAYVPCGFLDVPLWKQWPQEALADGRAVLRIDGKRYERQAVRVEDLEEWQTVMQLAGAKYGFGDGATPDPNATWLFRMDPRL
jgi:hypothetical protein